MSDSSQFDHYLTDDGPAALVIREHLMPVEGADGVLFPATFAAGDGFRAATTSTPTPPAATSASSTASARRRTGSSRCSCARITGTSSRGS